MCEPSICDQMKNSYGNLSCIEMSRQSINKLIIDIDGNSFSDTFFQALKTGSAVIRIGTVI